MSAVDDVRRLIDRAQSELEDWHDFFEHTKAVWRAFQSAVKAGETLRARNAVTNKEFSETDLTSLSQYYLTVFLAARCPATHNRHIRGLFIRAA